jgi:uncharacterized protein
MGAVRNAATGRVLASRVSRASTFLTRLIGLLPCARVDPDEGLWIEPCSAVHTIGMRARIDILFLDRTHTVLRLCSDVRGGIPVIGCKGAHAVIELGAGALRGSVIALGDRLEHVPVSPNASVEIGTFGPNT